MSARLCDDCGENINIHIRNGKALCAMCRLERAGVSSYATAHPDDQHFADTAKRHGGQRFR
jgi:hypothetical protein